MTSGDRPSKTMCTHIGPHYTKFDLCTACCEVEIGRMMAALARYETHELRPCGCPNTLPTTCDCPCHKRAADETKACICRVGDGPQEDCPVHGRGAEETDGGI